MAELSRKTAIPRRTLDDYVKGRSQPKQERLLVIARAAGVTIGWLATGLGPMRADDRTAPPPASEAVQKPASLGSVPVIGLAQCGLKGWYQEDAMTVRATRPADLADPEAFAVIVIGTSMIPAGIEPGFLLFCSPAVSAEPGDRVFVEWREGERTLASLKLMGKPKDGRLVLHGWLPPESGAAQTPYIERILSSAIARLAPVIYVKMKL